MFVISGNSILKGNDVLSIIIIIITTHEHLLEEEF